MRKKLHHNTRLTQIWLSGSWVTTCRTPHQSFIIIPWKTDSVVWFTIIDEGILLTNARSKTRNVGTVGELTVESTQIKVKGKPICDTDGRCIVQSNIKGHSGLATYLPSPRHATTKLIVGMVQTKPPLAVKDLEGTLTLLHEIQVNHVHTIFQ